VLEVIHGTGGRPSTVATGTFTGEVRRDPVRDADHGHGPAIGNVFFAPGARTYWHVHEAGQLLIAVAGAGWVGDADGATRLGAGDMVWTPAGVRHWHGASADQYLVHTSISMGDAEWQSEVSEEDYPQPDAALQ
jgi:quercetin dioxygenase-like cupin family protein